MFEAVGLGEGIFISTVATVSHRRMFCYWNFGGQRPPLQKSVTEGNVDVSRGLHQFAIRWDKFQPIDCFGDRHMTHLVVLITHHGSKVPLVSQLDSLDAEPCCENSVERCRRAAPLEMA